MHKKSIEAAQKMKEEEEKSQMGDDDIQSEKDLGPTSQSGQITSHVAPLTSQITSQLTSPGSIPEKEDRRFESIASLRAKAQSYTAKIREGICNDEVIDIGPGKHVPAAFSSFETPSKSSDSCDSELLDPTN